MLIYPFNQNQNYEQFAYIMRQQMQSQMVLNSCLASQARGKEHPLNFHKLMDTRDEVYLLERRIKHLQKIIEELFGDNKDE